VAAASFLISVTSIAVFVIARRYIEFSFTRPITRQLVAAIIMFAFVLLTRAMINNFFTLFVEGLFSGLVYIGVLYLLAGDELVKTFKFIIISIRSK
jgi:hypothetical protein